MLTVLVCDVQLPTLTDWGLCLRKLSTQLQRPGVSQSKSEELDREFMWNDHVKRSAVV